MKKANEAVPRHRRTSTRNNGTQQRNVGIVQIGPQVQLSVRMDRAEWIALEALARAHKPDTDRTTMLRLLIATAVKANPAARDIMARLLVDAGWDLAAEVDIKPGIGSKLSAG